MPDFDQPQKCHSWSAGKRFAYFLLFVALSTSSAAGGFLLRRQAELLVRHGHGIIAYAASIMVGIMAGAAIGALFGRVTVGMTSGLVASVLAMATMVFIGLAV